MLKKLDLGYEASGGYATIWNVSGPRVHVEYEYVSNRSPWDEGAMSVEPDEYLPTGYDAHGAAEVWGDLQCRRWEAPADYVRLWAVGDVAAGVEDGFGLSIWYAESGRRLTPADVLAIARAEEYERRRLLTRAHAKAAQLTGSVPNKRRQAIPDDIRMFVWQRDQGRCCRCDLGEALEFDHIIPVALGGSNTERNLQLLCEPCNRSKGANIA